MKKKINKSLVIALSSSMAFTSVAAPLTQASETVKTGSTDKKSETWKDEELENSKVGTPSNAAQMNETDKKNDVEFEDKEMEASVESNELFENVEYHKFGSDKFLTWFRDASNEEKEDWFNLISTVTTTASNASKKYPDFDLESDEFLSWFADFCVVSDKGSNKVLFDFDNLLKYVKTLDFDMAMEVLDFVETRLEMTTLSAIGNLWPDGYGSKANFLSDGTGSEENPYILDSVDDLRGFAAYVANSNDGCAGEYFRIESGSYDLNGCWIPVGFQLNDGGNHIAFRGNITAEENADIVNFGLGSNNTVGITSDYATKIKKQKKVGFFGELGAGAYVENLTIETNNNTIECTVSESSVGILAGEATDATIKNCTVRGHVKGVLNAGGIVGKIKSTRTTAEVRDSVIEGCNAEDVSVYVVGDAGNDSEYSAVGGIAGRATNTSVVDTYVSTNTGAGNHIYGKSNTYTGGIVGIQKNSDIYNAYVEKGDVGDSSAYANGGIVGGYDGGQIKVARFSGTVNRPSSTNNYSAAFIGTRVNNAGFTYGPNGNLAYLYTDTKSKADTGICGSKLQDDNNYGLDANIGYWHDNDKKYTLVTGANQKPSDEFFYQGLETGILNVIKNGKNTEKFVINHYTCDDQGNPVRGYLLTINEPKIEGYGAAKIKANIAGSSFKPIVTAENSGAYKAGDVIYVSFDAQSYGEVQFKLDENETANPYYQYNEYGEFGSVGSMKEGLTNNGGYYFTMPESDTVIGAKYKKVAKAVTIDPDKITFEVTQTRSGNRDNPNVKWTVTAKNDNGEIITDANKNKWENIELKTNMSNPEFYLNTLINGKDNDVFNILWSTANTDAANVINNAEAVNGNTADKKAKFSINITETSKMYKQAEELRNKQSANGNKDSITTNAPYNYHALITGTAQPKDSDEIADPPKGYVDINVKFNIVDNTKVSVDSASLNKNHITYDVVRTLSGDRAHPTEVYTINGKSAGEDSSVSALSAVFNPDYFDNTKVKWYLSEPKDGDAFEDIRDDAVEQDEGKNDDDTISVAVSGSGDQAYRKSSVTLKGVSSNSCGDNGFISPIVKDQKTKQEQLKKVDDTVHTYKKYVKVTAHDNNTNTATDTCEVIVNFKTVDNTEIMPTNVDINNKTNVSGYKVNYTFAGNKNSEVVKRIITKTNDISQTPLENGKGETLSATVSPEKDNSDPSFQPYDKSVTWSLANPEAGSGSKLDVNDILHINSKTGEITVRGFAETDDMSSLAYSPWIQSLISENKLDGTTVPVRIIATSNRDNSVQVYVDIEVTFVAQAVDTDIEDGITFDAVLTKNVATTLAGTEVIERQSWSGTEGQKIEAISNGTSEAPQFTVYDEDGINVSKGIASIDDSMLRSIITTRKYININKDADWIKTVVENRKNGNKGTTKLMVKAKTTNGTSVSEIPVTINFRYDGVDMTASKLDVLPEEYPDSVTSTEAETYDVSKVKVKDRDITLGVVATQGNYTEDNPGTRKWSFGIVKLNNTAYTPNGLMQNDATYELSGEIAKYAKVDKNGYLVPTKGNWEDVIASNKTTGSVSGILTAKKDIDGKETSDSYKVTINFRYDKAVLDIHEKTLDVVYTQDSQTNSPNSHWNGEEKFELTANIFGEDGTAIDVDWKSSEEGLVKLEKRGKYCTVTVDKDTWMKEIINNAQKYGAGKDSHNGTKTLTVTATDAKTGAVADTCVITINFRYDQAILDSHEEVFDVVLTQTSRTNSPSVKWSGNELRKLNADIYVEAGLDDHSYWSSEDALIVKVDESGNIQPVIDADWMKQTVTEGNFSGQKKVSVNVTNKDGIIRDSCNVIVNFKYENVVMNENQKEMNATLTATGSRSNPTYTLQGDKATVSAIINSINPDDKKVIYTSEKADTITVDANGNLELVKPMVKNSEAQLIQAQGTQFSQNASGFIKEAMKHTYSESTKYISKLTATIEAKSEDGRMSDQCNLTINLKYIDNTYSSSGGGGGGGGSSSGGGSHSSGVTPGGKTDSTANLPSYVISGTWVKDNTGNWLFTSGRTYANEWAAVHNPYADITKGQAQYDWFRFDEKGYMVTGWFTDPADGNTYFLHNVSDNTLGHMYTGWHWITGEDGLQRCYYFNPVSDGTRGKLFKNTTTPDEYTVDATGAWTVNGVVVTRNPQ